MIERWKDGDIEDPEYAYTTLVNKQKIKFIDKQDRQGKQFSRLKYMEFVPGDEEDEGFDQFPCIKGYRHMNLANKDDESVKVPALSTFNLDAGVRDVLGWDNNSHRILNWDKIQDNTKLKESSTLIQLFNPRPFALKSAMLHSHSDPTAVPPERPLKKCTVSGVFGRDPQKQQDGTQYHVRHPDRVEDGPVVNDDDDDAENASSNSIKEPVISSDSEENDPEWSEPPEDSREFVIRAWYKMLRADRRRQAEKEAAKEVASAAHTTKTFNMYYIISSFVNIQHMCLHDGFLWRSDRG